MNTNPNAYFVRAPMSWVERLPKPLYDLRNLSVNEFRETLFDEKLGLNFSIDDVQPLDMETLKLPHNWLYRDFGKDPT